VKTTWIHDALEPLDPHLLPTAEHQGLRTSGKPTGLVTGGGVESVVRRLPTTVASRPSSVASTLLHRRRRSSAVVVFLRQVLGSGHTLSSRPSLPPLSRPSLPHHPPGRPDGQGGRVGSARELQRGGVVMGTNPDHPTHVWRARGFAPCRHTSSLSLMVVGPEVGSGQEVGRKVGRASGRPDGPRTLESRASRCLLLLLGLSVRRSVGP